MPLTRFEDAQDYYLAALPWLQPQEAYNNLPLGLAIRLKQLPDLVERALMLIVSEANSGLVALQTRPNQMVIGQCEGAIDLIPELVEWLAQHQPGLQGLVAPTELAKAFARQWQACTGKSSHIEMNQRVYALSKVKPLQLPAGSYRLAQMGDLGLLLEWVEAFIAEALPHERPDRDGIRTATLRQIKAGDLGAWEHQDQIVSMAARTRPTLNGTAISLVYTPPELRGQGFASACTAAHSQAQLTAGKAFCCLFTDLANPTSNRIYQQIGYEPIGDFQTIAFGDPA
ncbi:MAG: hypothetical protein CVV27_08790 [Candidatus Melainabacteria bacterium HGW-Melainabacteria-1]|nr:MAG: hypothetical protein CVV27_08790 [Candidatus Melainabacteria bacterium HGW-Melainabacteria-1]